MDPAMRQNFANAFAETHNLNLEVRHIYHDGNDDDVNDNSSLLQTYQGVNNHKRSTYSQT